MTHSTSDIAAELQHFADNPAESPWPHSSLVINSVDVRDSGVVVALTAAGATVLVELDPATEQPWQHVYDGSAREWVTGFITFTEEDADTIGLGDGLAHTMRPDGAYLEICTYGFRRSHAAEHQRLTGVHF